MRDLLATAIDSLGAVGQVLDALGPDAGLVMSREQERRLEELREELQKLGVHIAARF